MKVFRQIPLLICFVSFVSSAFGITVKANGPSLVVNEVEVLKLRTSSGSFSPSERATILAGKLEKFLAYGGVTYKRKDKDVVLLIGGKPWLFITPQEAKAAGMAQMPLALAWAKALSEAAALPAVKITEDQMRSPVGGTRSITVVGSNVSASVVQVVDPAIAKATLVGNVLNVQGVSAGKTKIKLLSGSAADSVEVLVLPLAATFPQTVTATVVGIPATRATVAGSIASAINRDLRTTDGATLKFTAPNGASLPTGDSRNYQVRVKAEGPGAFPSEGVVTVNVKSLALSYRSESELWYCNHPEQVKHPGRLFAAALKAGEPARMLYHHINKSGTSLITNVEAINASNQPARILIIPGDADPNTNPVKAGLVAADRFVQSWASYSGEVVEIPPYSIMPISIRRLAPQETTSGLCYLRLLEDGPDQLIVRTTATLPGIVEQKWKTAMLTGAPWRYAGCKPIGDVASIPEPDTEHIYPDPFKVEDVNYSVGGPFGFVRIGQRPIPRQDNQGSLDGNFGVLYTITANLENPTSSPAEVEIVYEASAGYGGALFVIDGQIHKTALLQPKQESLVSRLRLEPGASKTFKMVTVPLSGSSYPCTITIRPVQSGIKG